jgi:hypothetical protein
MVYGGGAGAAVTAAAIARQRREILDAFRTAGATSRETAVPETSLKIRTRLVFHTMLKRGVIIRLPDGRLYLDEAAEAAARRTRLAILWVVLALGVAGVVVVLVLGR